MNCLGCVKVEQAAVKLRDGRQVCSSCPDWRDECFAKYIANLPGLEQRREFIKDISRIHGKQAADHIQQIATEIWKCMQSKKQ